MIQPIVVGIDGSSHADLAVEWAADEAVLSRRPLRVVYAAERWESDAPLDAAPGTCESLTDAGGRVLAEAAERAGKDRPGLRITTELIFDAPMRALRSYGRRAEMIVVGRRGRGGFTGMLLGSTGLRVAGHVQAPVIVVRGEARERRGEVVAGADLRDDPDDVLGYAFAAAARRGAWVRVIHAWDMPSSLPSISACEAAAMAQERLADAVAPWRARFPEIDVVEQTPRGHPVGELAGCSARAALLVVGSRGPGGRQGLVLGPVGHGVLHHADCPVAVTPAGMTRPAATPRRAGAGRGRRGHPPGCSDGDRRAYARW